MSERESHLSTEQVDEITRRAIKKAQEIAREEGLRIGQLVAHPSVDAMYELKEVDGNTAKVCAPNKEDTIREFPLDELFDPKRVMEIGRDASLHEIRNEAKRRLNTDGVTAAVTYLKETMMNFDNRNLFNPQQLRGLVTLRVWEAKGVKESELLKFIEEFPGNLD